MKNFTLEFTREEITHAVYTVGISPKDADKIKDMKTADIADWLTDQEFDWESHKEYFEEEGERGLFDFSLREYEETESKILTTTRTYNKFISSTELGGDS